MAPKPVIDISMGGASFVHAKYAAKVLKQRLSARTRFNATGMTVIIRAMNIRTLQQ